MRRIHQISRATVFRLGLGAFLIVIGWVALSGITVLLSAQVPYEVIERADGYEVRQYEVHTVASVVLSGTAQNRVADANALISAYLDGGNLRQPIEITTVRGKTTEAAEQIETIQPLLIRENAGEVVVSRMLPADVSPDSAPRPRDPRIRIDDLASRTVAVRSVSSFHDGTIAREREALKGLLGRDERLILSSFTVAQYRPAWIFPLLRRVEVHVKVR